MAMNGQEWCRLAMASPMGRAAPSVAISVLAKMPPAAVMPSAVESALRRVCRKRAAYVEEAVAV
jgi:hypothetical protein